KNSYSISQVLKKIGWSDNGRCRKRLKQFIHDNEIDISHFDVGRVNRKYDVVTKQCKFCGTDFETKKGHPKETSYCSQVCANSDRTHSESTKSKIQKSICKYYESEGIVERTVVCNWCSKSFTTKKKTQEFCSRSCSAKHVNNRPEYKENLRNKMIQKVKNGTHSGWKSRKGKKPSYAEKFFMDVLDNNNITWEHELPCEKYFIDLAIESKMIALEIDGKQHLQEERKQSDIRKDECLARNGWVVHRIPWKNPNTTKNKLYIKNEIDKFITLYQALAEK
ncbi:MAG: endonuclease domain-containing protein, partial [Candidatus Ranarchaeia archaeon]